jgi:hypothetical protein
MFSRCPASIHTVANLAPRWDVPPKNYRRAPRRRIGAPDAWAPPSPGRQVIAVDDKAIMARLRIYRVSSFSTARKGEKIDTSDGDQGAVLAWESAGREGEAEVRSTSAR